MSVGEVEQSGPVAPRVVDRHAARSCTARGYTATKHRRPARTGRHRLVALPREASARLRDEWFPFLLFRQYMDLARLASVAPDLGGWPMRIYPGATEESLFPARGERFLSVIGIGTHTRHSGRGMGPRKALPGAPARRDRAFVHIGLSTVHGIAAVARLHVQPGACDGRDRNLAGRRARMATMNASERDGRWQPAPPIPHPIGLGASVLALAGVTRVAWGRGPSPRGRAITLAIALITGIGLTAGVIRFITGRAFRTRRDALARGGGDPPSSVRSCRMNNRARFAPHLIADLPLARLDRVEAHRWTGSPRSSTNQRIQAPNGPREPQVARRTTGERTANRPSASNWPVGPIVRQ